MKVAHYLLPELRLVYVRLSPAANFRDMVRDFQTLVVREPDVLGYDYICDLTDFAGDAFCADVNEIAQAYLSHQPPLHQTHTCFVTQDAAFSYWASAMDEMFAGRKHVVFPSLSAAWAYLETCRWGSLPPLEPFPWGSLTEIRPGLS